MKDFTQLDVWQKARTLAKNAYFISDLFPNSEAKRLTDQVCRAAISIPSNIAEGVGRSTSKDKMRFMYMARGSCFELETQFYIAYDLNYLGQQKLEEMLKELTEVKKLINGFINYLNSRDKKEN